MYIFDNFYVGTKRFTNDTYNEILEWKKDNNWHGCVYPLCKKISKNIPFCKIIYIIEMNNDINKIMGIGRIYNELNINKERKIISDDEYNKYIYMSKHYMNRDELLNLRDGKYIVNYLETLLFKQFSSYKMGKGITLIKYDSILYDWEGPGRSKRYLCKYCGKEKRPNGIRPEKLHKYTCTGNKDIVIKHKRKHAIKKDKNDERMKKMIMFFNNLFN